LRRVRDCRGRTSAGDVVQRLSPRHAHFGLIDSSLVLRFDLALLALGAFAHLIDAAAERALQPFRLFFEPALRFFFAAIEKRLARSLRRRIRLEKWIAEYRDVLFFEHVLLG